jgi:hypothetical protein
MTTDYCRAKQRHAAQAIAKAASEGKPSPQWAEAMAHEWVWEELFLEGAFARVEASHESHP